MATDSINWRRIAMVLAGLWLLCAAIYLIMGQDVLPAYLLRNNSGADITVDVDGTLITIANGESGNLGFHARKLQPFLVEAAGGRRKTYTWVPIDHEWGFHRGTHMFWQIEADQRIYVLKPAPKGIVKELPVQPPGYPLEPR